MAPPPTYADMGKAARDLFAKGYNMGFLKIDSTTRPHADAEFKLNAAHNVDKGVLTGGLDIKYKIPKYGMTLTEKWNTANVIATELVVTDRARKGTKFTMLSDFSPATKARTAKAKAEFGEDNFRLNADLSLTSTPVLNASAVFRYENWLVGAAAGFNSEKSQLTNTNLALGRAFDNYVLHAAINDYEKYSASLYHRVNDRAEVAAEASWKQADAKPAFGIAAQYKIDKNWTMRAKVHQNSQVSTATTHRLNEHVKLTLSATFDMKNFKEGGHKFGAGLEYEPCC